MGRPGCRETRFVQANCMGGILAKNGMAGFSNSLSDADVEAIQQYLLKRQSDLYNQKKKLNAVAGDDVAVRKSGGSFCLLWSRSTTENISIFLIPEHPFRNNHHPVENYKQQKESC